MNVLTTSSQPRWERKPLGNVRFTAKRQFSRLVVERSAMDRSYGRGKIGNAKGAGSPGGNRLIEKYHILVLVKITVFFTSVTTWHFAQLVR